MEELKYDLSDLNQDSSQDSEEVSVICIEEESE